MQDVAEGVTPALLAFIGMWAFIAHVDGVAVATLFVVGALLLYGSIVACSLGLLWLVQRVLSAFEWRRSSESLRGESADNPYQSPSGT